MPQTPAELAPNAALRRFARPATGFSPHPAWSHAARPLRPPTAVSLPPRISRVKPPNNPRSQKMPFFEGREKRPESCIYTTYIYIYSVSPKPTQTIPHPIPPKSRFSCLRGIFGGNTREVLGESYLPAHGRDIQPAPTHTRGSFARPWPPKRPQSGMWRMVLYPNHTHYCTTPLQPILTRV